MSAGKIIYTWEELESDVSKLVECVREDCFNPTRVVGLSRGGLVPGVMVSHAMKLPFEALQWSKRDFASQSFGHYLDHICKNAFQQNERYLIVDDMLDSGETIGELQHYASKVASLKYWTSRIKFAVLWENLDCDVNIDYSARGISRKDDDRWICFPWEV